MSISQSPSSPCEKCDERYPTVYCEGCDASLCMDCEKGVRTERAFQNHDTVIE
jgi:hypothetical protein